MSNWIERDVRWGAHEAINARRKADELRDPEWVAHKVRQLRSEKRGRELAAEALQCEIDELTDDAVRERQAERHERDADQWDLLVAELRTYREQKEAGLFEEIQ